MSVALGTQREMRMSRITFCGLSHSTTFFLIISYRHDFRGGGEVLNTKSVKLMFFGPCIIVIVEE